MQTNEVGVEIIGTANVTDGKAYGYSPGLILHNYDTCAILLVNFTNGKTLINAYMGTGLQRDYVLNGMSTYIFFMSFVGDGSIVSTFFAVITTGENASKTGKILWVGNSAENYVSLTDGVTLHLHITSSIWMQCALAKV